MIAVRIPEDIRKYKEKLMFGLNLRQLIATVIAFGVCVPLYWFGRGFIHEELLAWLIILIAVPLTAIGYIRINNLPMERLIVAFLKYEILYPRKRKFSTANAFREWQNEAINEEKPKTFRLKLEDKKFRYQASLEKAVLIAEAEEKGIYDFDVNKAKLLTVSKSGGKNPKKDKRNKEKKDKEKEATRSALQKQGEEIERKQKDDPHYTLTKKEYLILKQWNQQKLEQRKLELAKKKKTVAKKSLEMKKRRKARIVIPRSTQDSIPYIADYDEGLFEVKPNKYSKMYRIKDINYKTSHEEEKIFIFEKLGEFINYFSEDMNFAFVIDNRIVSKEEQERKIFYSFAGDGYDIHRDEYNSILRQQIKGNLNYMQVEKFITITIDANTPIEALLRFHKIDAEVIDNLRRIGTDANVLSTTERLSYYHDKYRKGRESEFQIDFDFIKAQGISSKDYIAPTYFNFEKKHFQIEDDYYRVMYLNNLPSSLSDEFLSDLCDNEFPITVSMNIESISQEKGLKIIKRQLTGIEANKIEAEKRAIRAGYNPETIQHSIKDAHAQAEALYDEMMNKNQKMFFVTITFMVQGDTLDDLNENCRAIESKARKYTSQIHTFTMQQEEGYKITLPFGYTPQDISVERVLTTESTSIFMPFSNQEIFQPGGYYYGLNQISRNLIIVDRLKMKNGSGFILGTSGSGKSFAAKREILNVLLSNPHTGVLVIDPENEYSFFCRFFGGTVLKISADSNNYINPMDMSEDYGLDEDDDINIDISVKKRKAIKKKSDFIMSIIERMLSSSGDSETTSITPVQKTIIDRCVYRCYDKYLKHDFDPKYIPTLLDLQDELDKEKEISADGRIIAEGVEYYTRGSMDIFAHKTNVEVNKRFITFNVRDLGEQLKKTAQIIVFDFLWNRMVENKNKGIRTNIYADEIHTQFDSYYSANYIKQFYKRGRKYGLCITGMTQNAEELLRSEQARGMIGNSDFVMMLNQNNKDLEILAGLLGISENQIKYVTGAEPGYGLIFAEKVIVPFADNFPKESYLYQLMSTKFGEDASSKEIDDYINKLIGKRGD